MISVDSQSTVYTAQQTFTPTHTQTQRDAKGNAITMRRRTESTFDSFQCQFKLWVRYRNEPVFFSASWKYSRAALCVCATCANGWRYAKTITTNSPFRIYSSTRRWSYIFISSRHCRTLYTLAADNESENDWVDGDIISYMLAIETNFMRNDDSWSMLCAF